MSLPDFFHRSRFACGCFALLFCAIPGNGQSEVPFSDNVKPQFQFEEFYRDRVVLDSGFWWEQSVNDLLLDFTLSREGIPDSAFDDATPYQIVLINDYAESFVEEGVLGDGTKTSGTSYAIVYESVDSISGEFFESGTMTVSWNADTVRFRARHVQQEDRMVSAMNFAGYEDNDLTDILDTTLIFGNRIQGGRLAYITGTASYRTVTRDDEEFDVDSVTMKGGFDYVKPRVTRISPMANAVVYTDPLTISGEAEDNNFIEFVEVALNNGPYIKMTGSEYWTGQIMGLKAGKNEITVRCYDQDLNVSPNVRRSFIYREKSPLKVHVIGEGSVTSGFEGTSLQPTGQSITIKATPAPGWLFAGWSGGVVSPNAKLVFEHEPNLELTATFIPGPYIGITGKYRGNFSTATTPVAHAGHASFRLGPTGKLKGSVWAGKFKYPLKGRFKADRTLLKKLSLAGAPQFRVGMALQSGTNPPPLIAMGLLRGSGTVSSGQSERSRWNADDSPAPQAGGYTIIASGSAGAGGPAGPVVGTLFLDPDGTAIAVLDLPNGTLGAAKGVLSDAGNLALFKALQNGKASLEGTLAFADIPGQSDASGALQWASVPLAFVEPLAAKASRYTPPGPGQRVFPNNAATMTIEVSAPGLGTITRHAALSAGNAVTVTDGGPENLVLTVDPNTGRIGGSIVVNGARRPIKGVIFQKSNSAAAFIGISSSTAGSVNITTP